MSGGSFQVLARRLERSPLSDSGDRAGQIIADQIFNQRLPCDHDTVERIFGLFRCQWRMETLVSLENGSIPLISRASFTQFDHIAGWKCLHAVIYRYAKDRSLVHIRSMFLAYFDTLFRWLHIMANMPHHKVGIPTIGVSLAPGSHNRFVCVVTSLLSHLMLADQDMQVRVCSDHRLLPMVIKMWVLKPESPHGQIHAKVSYMFAQCVRYFETQPGDSAIQRMLEAFQELDVSHELIGDIASKYIRKAIDRSDWDEEETYAGIRVIHYFYSKVDATKFSLAGAPMVSLLTPVLKKASQSLFEGHSDTPQRTIGLLGYVLAMLRSMIRDTDFVQWMTGLLKDGLIRMLIQFDPWMEQFAAEHEEYANIIISFFTTYLPHLCLFKSSLTVLADELPAAYSLRPLANMDCARLRDAAEELQNIVNVHMGLIQKVVDTPARVYQICDAPGCRVPDFERKFRRCLGCLSCYYCSQGCQKMHWPSHRTTCQDTRQRYFHVRKTDIRGADMKSLKKMIGETVNDLSVDPQWVSDFEQSTHKQVAVTMNFEELPWEYSVEAKDGPPGILIVALVPRGGHSRNLFLETTLDYLHGHTSREAVD